MAGIKDFKKVAGATGDVAALQQRLYEFFTQFLNNPLLNGVLLTGVELSSTATQVPHTLGREPQGWIIVNKTANANVWQSSTDLSKSFLTLTASGAVKVDLWVF